MNCPIEWFGSGRRLWRRLPVPGLLVLGLLALTAACGAAAPSATPVASVITPVAPTPVVTPYYTDSSSRLVLPTLSPSPPSPAGGAGENRPVPTAEGSGADLPTPTPVGATLPVLSQDYPVKEAPVFTEAELDQVLSTVWQLPCGDEYRRMLFTYDGREEFGDPVVERLWHEFLELRPECAAEGGEPVFGRTGVCANSPRARDAFSGAGTRMAFIWDLPNIYVNFSAMPFDGRPGCWVRDASFGWDWYAMEPHPRKSPREGRRYWHLREAEQGYFPNPYPACDELLRIMLPRVAAARGGLDTAAVAASVDRVQELVEDDCRYKWELYPQDEPQPDCEVQSPTGPLPEGGYVIHWADPSREAYDRPCWVMGEFPGS